VPATSDADLPRPDPSGADPHQHELQNLTLARVDQALVRPAQYVEAATDIVAVVRLFSERRVTSVLVRGLAPGDGPGSLGIFTTAGLQRAILSGRPLEQLPVGELASRPLITVRPADPLYDALATMIRHRVQRVAVVDDTDTAAAPVVLGMLEQIDLLSFLSNHSYLITRQILEAGDLDTLRNAASQITRVIGLLHHGGTKVEFIARLVRELNAKLMERTWQLLAPAELRANACLFVMGSEGRGEQLLRTDQDNGLVLRDGYVPPVELDAICRRFSQALADFGYPECPGHIMLSNPQWRHSASDFSRLVRGWLLQPSSDSLMSLAIFLDARAVAGDAALLAQVRGALFELATDNGPLLAHFASAITAFDHLNGWWTRLRARDGGTAQLDLKKAGLFPLVHGVRTLALAHGIRAVSTAERIAALVAAGRLDAAMGADLVDSLHGLMGLKLKLGLTAMQAGRAAGDSSIFESLGSLEREQFKDTLAVVKRFKTLLRLRFHLDSL
jgi:CBS domain-containing protein